MDLCEKMHVASWKLFQMSVLVLIVMMRWY